MGIYLLAYSYIVLPIIILYLISIIETIISAVKKRNIKIKLTSHSAVIIVVIVFNLYNSEIFKSNRVMTATMADDFAHYTLILREDGTCENRVHGIFAYQEIFYGQYYFNNDTLIFSKIPYDNSWLPDTMLVSKKDSAIYIEKDTEGNFREVKEWLNHFKIQ